MDHFKEESENANTAYTSSGISTNQERINIESDTDFANAVNGKRAADIWPIVDELMTTLQVINPRLYAGVMRRLAE